MGQGVKLSVLIPYMDRAALLDATLRRYAATNGAFLREVEFIIVDNSGNQDEAFWRVCRENAARGLTIRPFSINEGTCNIVIPLNFGVRIARGEYILNTNPECWPLTPEILEHTYWRMDARTYLTCSCYSMTKRATDELLLDGTDPVLSPRAAGFDGDDGWYVHSQFNPRFLYFHACYAKEAVMEMNGFDEDYAHAHCFDDDDWRDRCAAAGLVSRPSDDLVTLHLYHYSRKAFSEASAQTGRQVRDRKQMLSEGPVRNQGREWGIPKRGVWVPKVGE
jgi:glycosyltransferase involved in cell wall biosynthesis